MTTQQAEIHNETSFDISLTHQAEKELLALPYSLRLATTDLILELKTFGNQLREPKVKSMGQGLQELRASSIDGISRSFFFFTAGKKPILCIFSKRKPQKPLNITLI